MKPFALKRETSAALVIDVQEKLIPHVENSCMVLNQMEKALRGFQLLGLPIIGTEQYPEGLGPTHERIRAYLCSSPYSKTTFSCCCDPNLDVCGAKQWILMGVEAHVCVLQTARDLLLNGYEVVILNNAISSRSIYDYSTAIAEMRDFGARISSVETVLFELLATSTAPEFKEISTLVKNSCSCE